MYFWPYTGPFLPIPGLSADFWTLHYLQREDRICVATKQSHTKKRRRDEQADMPEVPLADPFHDSVNLELPDLVHITGVDLDLFDTTQTSLYQARVEDITLMEENINLLSGSNLTFGEELAFPSAVDFFQNTDNVVDPVTTIESKEALSPSKSRRRPLGDVDQALEPEAKVSRIQSTMLGTLTEIEEPRALPADHSVLNLPDQDQITLNELNAVQGNGVNQELDQTVTGVVLVEHPPTTEAPSISAVTEAQPVTEALQTHEPEAQPAPSEMMEQQPIQRPNMSPLLIQQPPEILLAAGELDGVPLVQLDRLPSFHQGEVRRQRRVNKSKLLIDENIKITTAELRWNMDHGEDTMLPLESRLAEPASRTKTQYLLSRCVPRLFTRPARLDTALSSTLCDLWCRHRRWAEDQLKLGCEALEATVRLEPLDPSGRLTDVIETSIEQPRAGQANSSIGPISSSLLGTSNLLNITLNQQLDSTVSAKTPAVPEEPAPPPPPTVVLPPVSSSSVLNITPELPPQMLYETTTLVPVSEEREEQVKQSTLEFPEQMEQPQPIEPQPETNPLYTDSHGVWSRLQELLANSDSNSVEIAELCPPGTITKDASLVFATVLQLAKKRLIQPSQSEPYGPIYLRYY